MKNKEENKMKYNTLWDEFFPGMTMDYLFGDTPEKSA